MLSSVFSILSLNFQVMLSRTSDVSSCSPKMDELNKVLSGETWVHEVQVADPFVSK
jgi:hypothetical protein